MTRDGIVEFLLQLGVDHDTIDIPEGRGWVNSPCPMAEYMHGAGLDERPSFGVSINDEDSSVYYCFGCTQDAQPLSRLLHNVWLMTGDYPHAAADVFAIQENHVLRQRAHRAPVPDWAERHIPLGPLPHKVLKNYPLLYDAEGFEARRCREWLVDARGVPTWVQNLCRLRYDPDHSAVIFPLTDLNGFIYILRSRSRKRKAIYTISPTLSGYPDMKFPSLKRDRGVWFGMFLADWSQRVMLVEGELDAMRLMALGHMNVIASATSQVTDLQLDALSGEVYVLGYDSDKAGVHATRRVVDRLGARCACLRADWSLANTTNGKPCKDAGDLPDKEELEKVLRELDPLID